MGHLVHHYQLYKGMILHAKTLKNRLNRTGDIGYYAQIKENGNLLALKIMFNKDKNYQQYTII